MSGERAPRRRTPRLAILAVLVCAMLTTTPAAWAYWSATQQLSPGLTAASLATPAPTCANSGSGAQISWPAVPGATSYSVVIGQTTALTAVVAPATTSTTATITPGLLTSLLVGGLASLLTALLGGSDLRVYVQARHTSGWVSAQSAGTPVYLSGSILAGTIRCR